MKRYSPPPYSSSTTPTQTTSTCQVDDIDSFLKSFPSNEKRYFPSRPTSNDDFMATMNNPTCSFNQQQGIQGKMVKPGSSFINMKPLGVLGEDQDYIDFRDQSDRPSSSSSSRQVKRERREDNEGEDDDPFNYDGNSLSNFNNNRGDRALNEHLEKLRRLQILNRNKDYRLLEKIAGAMEKNVEFLFVSDDIDTIMKLETGKQDEQRKQQAYYDIKDREISVLDGFKPRILNDIALVNSIYSNQGQLDENDDVYNAEQFPSTSLVTLIDNLHTVLGSDQKTVHDYGYIHQQLLLNDYNMAIDNFEIVATVEDRLNWLRQFLVIIRPKTVDRDLLWFTNQLNNTRDHSDDEEVNFKQFFRMTSFLVYFRDTLDLARISEDEDPGVSFGTSLFNKMKILQEIDHNIETGQQDNRLNSLSVDADLIQPVRYISDVLEKTINSGLDSYEGITRESRIAVTNYCNIANRTTDEQTRLKNFNNIKSTLPKRLLEFIDSIPNDQDRRIALLNHFTWCTIKYSPLETIDELIITDKIREDSIREVRKKRDQLRGITNAQYSNVIVQLLQTIFLRLRQLNCQELSSDFINIIQGGTVPVRPSDKFVNVKSENGGDGGEEEGDDQQVDNKTRSVTNALKLNRTVDYAYVINKIIRDATFRSFVETGKIEFTTGQTHTLLDLSRKDLIDYRGRKVPYANLIFLCMIPILYKTYMEKKQFFLQRSLASIDNNINTIKSLVNEKIQDDARKERLTRENSESSRDTLNFFYTGIARVKPMLVDKIDKAYHDIVDYCPDLTGITLKDIQSDAGVNSGLLDDFARLIAIEIANTRLVYNDAYKSQKNYEKVPMTAAECMKRLKGYKFEGRSGSIYRIPEYQRTKRGQPYNYSWF